ncbi:hypothetical protein FBULB1_2955 [Fusarium bulbicola]|nr:hypothetical protein FBULB1_2955 [Fusarium bulbicola]
MFEITKQLSCSLDEIEMCLSNLPVDLDAKELDLIIQRLSENLAFAKLHRCWQRAISSQGQKQMNSYFNFVYGQKSRDAKTTTERDRKLLAKLEKDVHISAHIINSTAFTVAEVRKVEPEIIEQMTQTHLVKKFMAPIWSTFTTFVGQQDELPEPPVEELSCVGSTHIFQSQLPSKRSWNESEGNFQSVEHGTQKRREMSISTIVDDFNPMIPEEASTSQSDDRGVSNPTAPKHKGQELYGKAEQITFESIRRYWNEGLELYMMNNPTGEAYVSKVQATGPLGNEIKSCLSIWLSSTELGDKMVKGETLESDDLRVPEALDYPHEPAGPLDREDPEASILAAV